MTLSTAISRNSGNYAWTSTDMKTEHRLGRGVPFDEVRGRCGGTKPAREYAKRLPRAEIRLHAGLERRELLCVSFRRYCLHLMRAQLQTLYTIITCITIVTTSRIFVIILFLSLSQSSTVKFHTGMSIGCRIAALVLCL